tara:strand:- start:37453 stop:38064 length:612 start_codon:yes stop_codon:yes gene_type:complete
MEGTTKHTPDVPLDGLIGLVLEGVQSSPVTDDTCDKIMAAGDAVLASRLVPQPDLNPYGWNNQTCMALDKVYKIVLKMGENCADDDLHHELNIAVQAAARLMDPSRSWGDDEVAAKDSVPDELPTANATPSKTSISDLEQLTNTLQLLASMLPKKRGLNASRKWWTGRRAASSREASAKRMAWVRRAALRTTRGYRARDVCPW